MSLTRVKTIRLLAAASVASAALLAAPAANASGTGPAPTSKKLREMIFVGSNWEGTVEVIRPSGKFKRVAQINMIPDIAERMAEIVADPVRLGFYIGIRALVGEGNDQFVDDMYTSKDGRLLIASRPSLADVVAIDLKTREVVWRFVVDGQRSDHMAISPDGRHVAVSASTGNVVHVLKVKTGEEVGKFESGNSPHENIYSADGSKIYHASIGLVYTPADQPQLDTTKGDRYFQVVDAKTLEILSQVDMGQKLEEAGYPGMSSAVRPMAITKDERRAFLQVSFFHGIVEYDLRKEKVLRVVDLPIRGDAVGMPRELYLLDSAHHGIALSGSDKKLCVAGTMSDYVAMVKVSDLRKGDPTPKMFTKSGKKPYWATTSRDGKRCYVSWSATDNISVFDYEKRKEIANVPVGNHPQRIRTGDVRVGWLRSLR